MVYCEFYDSQKKKVKVGDSPPKRLMCLSPLNYIGLYQDGKRFEPTLENIKNLSNHYICKCDNPQHCFWNDPETIKKIFLK